MPSSLRPFINEFGEIMRAIDRVDDQEAATLACRRGELMGLIATTARDCR
jgi:hypothetical protein